jgi:hypothetical protein
MMPVSALYVYSELEKPSSKTEKMIQKVSDCFWRWKTPCKFFFVSLNSNYSAKVRCRELTLISLNNFSAMRLNETAMKNVQQHHFLHPGVGGGGGGAAG